MKKYIVYYNGSHLTFETALEDIAQTHKGKVLEKDFFKGETSIILTFPTEEAFQAFFEEGKKSASHLNFILAQSGLEEIDL